VFTDVIDIALDGNCLFRACLLAVGGNDEDHARLRREVVQNVVSRWDTVLRASLTVGGPRVQRLIHARVQVCSYTMGGYVAASSVLHLPCND
jgi:uncharacterized protein (UPF0303 family)